MSIELIISLLISCSLIFLIGIWYIQAFNEINKIDTFNNIFELIEYHQRYLVEAYIRIGNDECSKKFQIQLNEQCTTNYNKIAEKLDNIASSYNEMGKYIESRNIYVEALKLRKWIYPENHPDIENNLNNLMISHSNLKDYRAARSIFEYQMQQRNYKNFLHP